MKLLSRGAGPYGEVLATRFATSLVVPGGKLVPRYIASKCTRARSGLRDSDSHLLSRGAYTPSTSSFFFLCFASFFIPSNSAPCLTASMRMALRRCCFLDSSAVFRACSKSSASCCISASLKSSLLAAGWRVNVLPDLVRAAEYKGFLLSSAPVDRDCLSADALAVAPISLMDLTPAEGGGGTVDDLVGGLG